MQPQICVGSDVDDTNKVNKIPIYLNIEQNKRKKKHLPMKIVQSAAESMDLSSIPLIEIVHIV